MCATRCLIILLVCYTAFTYAGDKRGCGLAKASVNTKRSIISNGNLNVDVSALEKGVKRSISEEDDCDNVKKSIVEIKEAAVSAIPGQNEEITNEKKSNVQQKDSHEYLVLPNKDTLPLERKDKLEKPNKKHSPLWSLSKLIENVDSKSAKKANVVKQKTPTKSDKSSTKSNLATATDPAKAIKATLSKAIEKVEKVIASKNGDARSSKTSDSKSSKPSNTEKITVVKAAAPKDPYAEIAMGPDRPKIPELKSDAGDSSPVMKMANGEMKPVSGISSDPAMRNAKPLGGEHDVGGLLDRLTDKLNSGGGGVALDSSPLASESNEVKYVQNSVSNDEASEKQAQEFAVDKLKDQADISEVKKMTEQDGLYAGAGESNSQQSLLSGATAAAAASSNGESTDDLASLARSADSGASPSSEKEASLAAAALASSSTSNAESTGEDDSIAKSLTKASSLSTDAVMDILKSGKIPGTDFSNADVSAGPDPYANTAESQQSTEATDESLSSLLSGSKGATSTSSSEESSDPLTGAGLESASDLTGGLGGALPETTSDSTGLTGADDLASRSTESTSQSDEDFERDTIPTTTTSDENYRDSYNTEIFKKHIIMRPKRDNYKSPFNSKEAFDTAI